MAPILTTAFGTYVDLSFIGMYQAWVQLFGMLVSIAVILSVLVAVDRLTQVLALLSYGWALFGMCVALHASGRLGMQRVVLGI